jgi:hypothetical protein
VQHFDNVYNSYFFKQVVVDVTTDWITLEIEVDIHVFAKTTRVVISVGLRVAERFKNTV